jgi:ribosomal protein S18 acetylase RimI-like enzyme
MPARALLGVPVDTIRVVGYKPAMGTAQFSVVGSVTDEDTASLWPVYRSVFDDQPTMQAWRSAAWDRHRLRAGFRLARAYHGGTLVGFAYGYTGEFGQWWTDNAREVLPKEVADAWLGGHFELVSLGVVEEARRAGVGRGLMEAISDGLEHDRLLLMTTSDDSDPARRLYASVGWEVIGPGIGEGTVVMGKHPRP